LKKIKKSFSKRSDFDEAHYLLCNPELLLYCGDLYKHSLEHGLNEQRIIGQKREYARKDEREYRDTKFSLEIKRLLKCYLSNGFFELHSGKMIIEVHNNSWIPGRNYWGNTVFVDGLDLDIFRYAKENCIRLSIKRKGLVYNILIDKESKKFISSHVREGCSKLFINQGNPLNYYLIRKLMIESEKSK
jgi:hypothetical protein